MGKQIKKFKLLYIYKISSQNVPGNTLDSEWHCHWLCTLNIFIFYECTLYIYIYMNYEWTIKDDDHF